MDGLWDMVFGRGEARTAWNEGRLGRTMTRSNAFKMLQFSLNKFHQAYTMRLHVESWQGVSFNILLCQAVIFPSCDCCNL